MILAWFYKHIDDILFPCSFLVYVIDSTSGKTQQRFNKESI